MRVCGIKGCERPHAARGWCLPHYKRWRRWGDPEGSAPEHDYVAAFWAKVDKAAGCWIWTAAVNHAGYGIGWTGDVTRLAHRMAYEYQVGPIPDGLELDHLCKTPACVNPAHLEPVTHAENVRRSDNYWAQRTHCKNGHKFTPENTRIRTKPKRQRVCRACKNERERAARDPQIGATS